MKVLVIGASAGCGREAVKALLDGGHEVTAFARHAGALELRSERLQKATGDALDASQVERVVAGQDAVIVALGVNENPLKVRLGRTKTPVDVCSRGTKNAMTAMKEHGVQRLVVLSAYGVGETRDRLPLPWKLAYRLLLRDQIADKEVQERAVRESGLDWVIAQPVGLNDKPASGDILVSESGEVRRGFISRADVGRFLASAAVEGGHVHRSVALSG